MKLKATKNISLILLLTITCLILPGSGLCAKRAMVDQLGRQIIVPAHPLRIVALAPSITEVVFALGQEKKLKGATQFSNYPPEAARLPKVGSYVHLDLERIVALRPDLCLAIKDGNPKHIVDRLATLNIPVYAVDPRGLNSVMETIHEIGELIGAGKKAAELVSDMQRRINLVDSRISTTVHRPRVFFQIGIAPIVSIGTDTFIHELIVRSGGINLTAGKTPYPRFSKEQVLGLSPEVFIITSMARGGAFEKIKSGWSKWKEMPAVKNDRIYLVNSDILDRPTPRIVDGLEMLVKVIHPELFKPDLVEDKR
ncbi:MAG: cobalamin-binding protein [Deltaproteobacteria bacterium]|nr:cobalamin-binding protein [Deltaproteobacteria bacterium]